MNKRGRPAQSATCRICRRILEPGAGVSIYLNASWVQDGERVRVSLPCRSVICTHCLSQRAYGAEIPQAIGCEVLFAVRKRLNEKEAGL